MASEAQLRRRMRDLENQIRQLQEQEKQAHAKMVQEMNKRLSDMQKQYEQNLQRQKEETDEMYAARLRRFQEEVSEEMQRKYRELEDEAAKVVRQQQEKLKELADCNEELRGVLNEMKAHQEYVDVVHKDHAMAMLQQAQSAQSSADQTPHEFFFNGEFDIIKAHAEEILDEIKQEMYQAAAADASGVMMNFELLATKVEQALHEWMLAFQDYAAIVKGLAARIQLLEKQPLKTKAGEFAMNLEELNFWSCGAYLPCRERILGALETVEAVEEKGIVAYLKEQKGAERKAIFTQVTEAKKWTDELAAIINCILSERALSDERWVLSKALAKVMKSHGYRKVRRQFRPPEEMLLEAPWYPAWQAKENPLDCMDLVVTINGADLLYITFLPIRENGVVVRNECILSLQAVTLPEPNLVQDQVAVNASRAQAEMPQIRVVGIPSGEGRAPIQAQEQLRKKQPSPAQQIQHLERKYH